MSPAPSWHPWVVHFPLGLVVVATALLIAARVLRSETLAGTAATVGTWNLCLGAIAAVFALASGFGAVLELDLSAAAREAVSLHLKWAMFTTLMLVLLAVWRGAGTVHASRPSWVFLIVLIAAAAALVFTGYRGGKNVYEYGVGVKKIAVRSSIDPARLEVSHQPRDARHIHTAPMVLPVTNLRAIGVYRANCRSRGFI